MKETQDKTPRKRVSPTTEAAARALLKRSDKPVLVQFYSPECGVCHVNKKEIEEAAAELGDSAHVIRINGETSPKLADELGVEAYPETFIYKNGKVAKQISLPKKSAEYVKAVKKAGK